ncbi:MAG: CPBP family intramembrane glutamic endopeptidase [Halioglobus sp.]
MSTVALLCLLTPSAMPLVAQATAPFSENISHYVLAAACILAFFALWSRRRAYQPIRQSLWISYLLWISIAEEVAFRLLLPAVLEIELSRLHAHIISNAMFALIHYFTLRWRAVNCCVTFLGGMGLSHLMGQGDLVLVILVHWVGTFMNTPWPPNTRRHKC